MQVSCDNSEMKFLFDLFPVLLFFVAFKLQGIYVATAVAMIATFVQIGWLVFRGRKIEPMLWISLAIITTFGGATLFFHDETFIKWKPTVLYWAFASILIVSATVFRKNLIRTLMNAQVKLPDSAWARLNWSWAVFFTLMGILNLYVAFNYPLDTWVNFKLFGATGLMLIFVLGQGVFLAKHIQEETPQLKD